MEAGREAIGTCGNDCTRLRGEDTRVLMSIADVSTGILAISDACSDFTFFFLFCLNHSSVKLLFALPLARMGRSCGATGPKLGRW